MIRTGIGASTNWASLENCCVVSCSSRPADNPIGARLMHVVVRPLSRLVTVSSAPYGALGAEHVSRAVLVVDLYVARPSMKSPGISAGTTI